MIKAKTADLLSLPCLDEDKAFTYEIEKDESAGKEAERRKFEQVVGTSHLFIQTALLYTASDGTRRIRVHNTAVPLTSTLSGPVEAMDVNALTLFLARQSMNRIQTVPNLNSARSLVEMTCSSICR